MTRSGQLITNVLVFSVLRLLVSENALRKRSRSGWPPVGQNVHSQFVAKTTGNELFYTSKTPFVKPCWKTTSLVKTWFFRITLFEIWKFKFCLTFETELCFLPGGQKRSFQRSFQRGYPPGLQALPRRPVAYSKSVCKNLWKSLHDSVLQIRSLLESIIFGSNNSSLSQFVRYTT